MERIYSIDELRRILSPVFVRYGVKCAILFGSYGKARATEKSNVDLLVDSGLRGLQFIGFAEDLRSALGKNIDVFDVSHIEPHSSIEREIRNTGGTPLRNVLAWAIHWSGPAVSFVYPYIHFTMFRLCHFCAVLPLQNAKSSRATFP